MSKPYYTAYINRYQKVYQAGIDRWGHSIEDPVLIETLTCWVTDNHLQGKQVIEFACGEGASGLILSRLGCVYHGVDIAGNALEKARETLKEYPLATFSQLDMVKDPILQQYDAALDSMGLHMLVTDRDRSLYLQNAYHCLKENAPMLFFRELHKEEAYHGAVEDYEAWKQINHEDYTVSQPRYGKDGTEVWLPLVPGRAKAEADYRQEFSDAGFLVEQFVINEINRESPYSANIYVRKQAM